MVLNPAEHAVGLTLYLEPRYSGDQAEVEEKIILGQRHGNWKWAFNLTHHRVARQSPHNRGRSRGQPGLSP